ncbi:hypothetical protein M422DRAFT_28593 [Sphaerobolus stellatus SS14]|uniref:Uncharacterized protein n=1 Tax=Sphaerobolus stellatus (strain SS14) TaxID=990650 RepID=A0A0C9W4K1_SPHS4|nr:hypothetical protein M422DRAFT_28593 [Sphaerobolus stellatus SS14]
MALETTVDEIARFADIHIRVWCRYHRRERWKDVGCYATLAPPFHLFPVPFRLIWNPISPSPFSIHRSNYPYLVVVATLFCVHASDFWTLLGPGGEGLGWTLQRPTKVAFDFDELVAFADGLRV